MISYLNGVIASKSVDSAVIEVAGVGYELLMPAGSLEALGSVGEQVKVLVSMQIREDSISLFGFVTQEERFAFEKLKTVSGVGPKVALSAVSTLGASALMSAVANEDNAAISKVPGIGKKTAQRIVIDLKGVFDSMVSAASFVEEQQPTDVSSNQAECTAALLSMGFTGEEAALALGGYTGDDDVQKMLRYALKRLGS